MTVETVISVVPFISSLVFIRDLIPLKSELQITNANTTQPVGITIYMMACAAPGGA